MANEQLKEQYDKLMKDFTELILKYENQSCFIKKFGGLV